MKKIRVILIHLCALLLAAAAFPQTARGADYVPLLSPAVILMEQNTGKILYGKNEHARMYPASMTKILTSLVALDYLEPDDVIVVGREIFGLPPDYNTAEHFEGESITVRNLIRSLMIRSTNESGCILALNAIRAKENLENVPYADAERMFCQLMTEKARSLGALESNFTNPYGLHDTAHFTTAYDLALISKAYMENEELRLIAGEREYAGDSLEGRRISGAQTGTYDWINHNELLLGGANTYPSATGIKTGFHDDAGYCVTASASKNGLDLIAVVFFSTDSGRFQDAKVLFDYGFETYAFMTIQEPDAPIEVVSASNVMLGEDDQLRVLGEGTAEFLMNQEEFDSITRVVTYDADVLAPDSTSDAPLIMAPVEEGMKLGTVTYSLDGEVLFETAIYAENAIPERDFDSDMDYYIKQFKENVFSVKALPYWFGGLGLLVGVIGLIAALAGRRSSRKDRWRGSSYGGGYGRWR